jgi:cAMP-dependent protein kinase regulator
MQGEKADEFFIVESGQLGAYKDGSGAQPVMRYGPGSYFGELALINNDVRAASVRALADCSLLVMSRPDFEQLLGPLLPALREAAKQYNMLANSRLGRVGAQSGLVCSTDCTLRR